MTSPDIEAAEQFLTASARVLERRRFERLFRGGDAGLVRDAVAAYRNPDGGFGHALEPDGRCPASQPLAIDFALRVLLEAGAWDTALADGACGWLAAHAPDGGGAVFVEPSIEGWPHAPWLVPVKGDGEGGGGPAHPWLSQATELLWSRIDALADVGPYDMRALFWFLDNVPDRDRARAAMEKIGPMIFDGMVALDPETPGEVHFPLDFAPLPGSLARGLFDQQVIDAGLDHLAAAQLPDGGWTFNWMDWSPAAEREWRGCKTVEALHILRANARC